MPETLDATDYCTHDNDDGNQRTPGKPKAEVTKERITIRLSPNVVSAFRAGGAGWQTRMDAALRDWLDGRPVA